MRAILDVINIALNLYWIIIIAGAVFSWLYVFNVINTRNQFVAMVGDFLYKTTEPVLRPIRRFMPDLGGIDISPIVALFAIILIQRIIALYIYPYVP